MQPVAKESGCGPTMPEDICEMVPQAVEDVLGRPMAPDDWDSINDGAGEEVCQTMAGVDSGYITDDADQPPFEGEAKDFVITDFMGWICQKDCGFAGIVANRLGSAVGVCFTRPGYFPIDLSTGHKLEPATDLTIQLPGDDYSFKRLYRSNPQNSGHGIVGVNWSAGEFAYIESVTGGVDLHVAEHRIGFECLNVAIAVVRLAAFLLKLADGDIFFHEFQRRLYRVEIVFVSVQKPTAFCRIVFEQLL